ncbi:frizzled class receptor 3, partial [Nothobranchius furzeri]
MDLLWVLSVSMLTACVAIPMDTAAGSHSLFTCEPITLRMCQGLSYNSTFMPNVLNHYDQQTAALAMEVRYTANTSRPNDDRSIIQKLFFLSNNFTKPPDSLPLFLQSTDFCHALMSFSVSKVTHITQHLTSHSASVPKVDITLPSPHHSTSFPPSSLAQSKTSLNSSLNPDPPP